MVAAAVTVVWLLVTSLITLVVVVTVVLGAIRAVSLKDWFVLQFLLTVSKRASRRVRTIALREVFAKLGLVVATGLRRYECLVVTLHAAVIKLTLVLLSTHIARSMVHLAAHATTVVILVTTTTTGHSHVASTI